jgi:SnoaL-like domain
MNDDDIRAALAAHWAASDAQDFEVEHRIYAEDAVLEYPQSGERIRTRKSIQTTRTLQPDDKRFSVRRTLGSGRLWITELVLSYDDRPYDTVSIMEFGDDGKVCRETQYFCDPFPAAEWRSQWVERM